MLLLFRRPYGLNQGGASSETPPAPDTTPGVFSFTDATGASLSSLVLSNVLTLTGTNADAAISIVGGEYRINGGSWTAASGTISPGSTFQVRGTSSGSYSDDVDIVLTIGGVNDTFTITTLALGATLTAPTLDLQSGSDDGDSASDNETSLEDLEFDAVLPDGLSGDTVRLYDDAVEIASDTWAGTPLTFSGVTLAEGEHTLTMTYERPGGDPFSHTSDPLVVTVVSSGLTSPSDLGADLVGWWKADTGVFSDAGTTPAVNTDQVRQWNDQSGANHHLYNVTGGNRPIFKAASDYNASHPSIDFPVSGANWLWTALQSIPSSTTQISAFVVGRMRTGSPNYGRFLGWNTAATGTIDDYDKTYNAILLCRDATNNGISSYWNGSNRDPQAISLNTNYRLGTIHDGSAIKSYVNGVAGAGASATASFGANGALCVGAGWSSFNAGLPSGFLDGEILEIVLVKRELISDEIADLDAYFTTKWGT